MITSDVVVGLVILLILWATGIVIVVLTVLKQKYQEPIARVKRAKDLYHDLQLALKAAGLIAPGGGDPYQEAIDQATTPHLATLSPKPSTQEEQADQLRRVATVLTEQLERELTRANRSLPKLAP